MTVDAAAARAKRTYDAAADHYDALGFWARLGERTVARLDLRAGARVLDAPCGSGASALAAARAVGPAGAVIGADVSGGLIALARSKAPPHVEFRVGDMRALGHPDASFDAVICVFGIFFAPDTAGLAAELWRMVRPGGVLAVTTWGEGAFEPGASAFWDAVGDARPELVRGYNPWDDLVTVDGVAELLARAGIDGAVVEAEDSDQPLAEPADWWRILVGSGYRATVDALGEDERAEVERRVLAAMRDVPPMRTPAIFAVARKVRA